MPARKMFPNSVVPLLGGGEMGAQGLIVGAAEPIHRAETMHLHFSLAPPAAVQKELEERVMRGDVIPFAEQEAKYGADAAGADRLVDWLKGEGFTVSRVSRDHGTIYASAPASQVEASLGVNIVCVARDGETFTSASDAPSLPADIAGDVYHIGGLQPFLRMRRHGRIGRIRPADDLNTAPAVATAPRVSFPRS